MKGSIERLLKDGLLGYVICICLYTSVNTNFLSCFIVKIYKHDLFTQEEKLMLRLVLYLECKCNLSCSTGGFSSFVFHLFILKKKKKKMW